MLHKRRQHLRADWEVAEELWERSNDGRRNAAVEEGRAVFGFEAWCFELIDHEGRWRPTGLGQVVVYVYGERKGQKVACLGEKHVAFEIKAAVRELWPLVWAERKKK